MKELKGLRVNLLCAFHVGPATEIEKLIHQIGGDLIFLREIRDEL